MTRSPYLPSPALRRRAALALGGALLLAGCHKAPTGQVAASVDGDEITLTEINTELANARVPDNVDKKAVQAQAVQRIVERKLLANAAKEDNIDQTPEFVVRRQQLEEALLVQMLTQKVARGLKTPTTADLDKFMTDNPTMFAQRTIFTLDQLRFPAQTNPAYLKQLASAKTMPAVVAVLDALNIKYQRGTGQLDSATVPPPLLAQIEKVPAGEPFVVPAGNLVVVSLITGSRNEPLTGDAARGLATNAVRNTKLGEALKQRLDSEKAKAKIDYQPGFAPPANGPGAPATGK